MRDCGAAGEPAGGEFVGQGLGYRPPGDGRCVASAFEVLEERHELVGPGGDVGDAQRLADLPPEVVVGLHLLGGEEVPSQQSPADPAGLHANVASVYKFRSLVIG